MCSGSRGLKKIPTVLTMPGIDRRLDSKIAMPTFVIYSHVTECGRLNFF